jgi:hypothetical protein
MNERIRELSEQAHHSTADELAHLQRVHNRTYDLNESAAIYNEKFAELIVAECVGEVYPDNFKVDGVEPANLADAVSRIKQHFGVEK